MTLPAMYILTDANGFTTCCEATQEAAFREAGRVPLLAPIEVVHWARTRTSYGTEGPLIEWGDWTLAYRFLWNGSDLTWR